MRYVWTPERIARFKRMWASTDLPVMAERYGMTRRQIVARASHLRRQGHTLPVRPNVVTNRIKGQRSRAARKRLEASLAQPVGRMYSAVRVTDAGGRLTAWIDPVT